MHAREVLRTAVVVVKQKDDVTSSDDMLDNCQGDPGFV
jgi:hypothetical protein